jgi:thioredoxin-related protein
VTQLLLAVVVVLVAAGVAEVIRRRRGVDVPTQRRHQLPAQLDRDDFVRPDAPWLVAVFTSDTCSTCADVVRKASVVGSPEVAVQTVSYQDFRELHDKYDIDAVPGVVVADGQGVTQAAFLGPVTATDLWAAVASAREPGSVPDPRCERHQVD